MRSSPTGLSGVSISCSSRNGKRGGEGEAERERASPHICVGPNSGLKSKWDLSECGELSLEAEGKVALIRTSGANRKSVGE